MGRSERGQSLTALRERVDLVATELVLAEGAGAESILALLSESMESLREMVGQAGAHQLESAAGAIAAAGSNPAALAEAVTCLRNAIDQAARETRENRPPPGSSQPNALAQDQELLRDFVFESRDHLANVEASALKLEQDPLCAEPIHSAFRGFHTIKGLAGFLELERIRAIAHEIETLLDHARNGQLAVTPAVIDVVLAGADYLSQELRVVEESLAGRAAKAPEAGDLVSRIRRAMTEPSLQTLAPLDKPPPVKPESVPEIATIKPAEESLSSTKAPPASPEIPVHAGAPAAPRPPAQETAQLAIRVDTGKLDHLFDMVGELVIAQSMVRHDPVLRQFGNPRIQAHLAQLARITDDVQKTTMALRMLPIGNLFQRMKRLVRDVSRSLGKQAELELSGEDTELDKNIVDSLAGPLMHMVRNAVDHGVEMPEDRVRQGKAPAARIALRAFHQSGQMVIEIADDGRGLDKDRILQKAREKGLLAEGVHLTESEIYHLVFEPGFSTAERVTGISGRGVGMDVVKKNIQKMRGRIEITTEAGKGTTFTIRLPLTLAIIDGLVVSSGPERYIVPIFAVTEMFRPEPGAISTVQGRQEMVLVRDQLLPVVRLYRRFGVSPRTTEPEKSLFIVCESEGKRFCLMVDDFVGKQEVVIKSLGDCFRNIQGVAGGAILGDGKVGLILELGGVFREHANA